jgi:hypothetical protein
MRFTTRLLNLSGYVVIPAATESMDGMNGASAWQPTFHELTLPALRLTIGRALVLVSFIWPFFNFDLIVPGNTMEVNFLFVFLAALILPEIFLEEWWSILFAVPAFLVALIAASPTSCLRLIAAIVPLHFIFNLTRALRARGLELVPANVAYHALKVFVLFCAAQTIQMNFFHIIPAGLSDVLVSIVPRYWTVPYDHLGVHGVQGWASEPSSAGLTTIAFALVAIHQKPELRWKVMAWFCGLLMLNKSIYATLLAVLLLVACLQSLRHKVLATLALIPAGALVATYMVYSGRVAILRENLLIDGLNSDSNHELARFVQILSPLQQLPHIYKPVILFGSWVMEPMGLLPLVVGYGSIFGFLWLLYIIKKNFPIRQVRMRPFWLIALFVLLFIASADLVCSIVALAVFLVPRGSEIGHDGEGANISLGAQPITEAL